ncbi:S-type pyocin domain-containing protein [Pseudomonas huaxiensis]|uniref:S-type pyocin domain-containing protein n=1 Tax=Pseudomonas huaxiensis TaxID=2213017 RepID=UPI000DA68CA2|nr:S-type pyocin domain-containing protein [Pseudomonas huaxiensis]
MADQNTDNTLYLTEGLLIEAYPDPNRIPRAGDGGGGRGSGGWGLTEGPRRGQGGPGRFTGPAIPGFKTVIIEEHVNFTQIVDTEYEPRYSTLDATLQAQINAVKNTSSNATLPTADRFKAEHKGLLEFIAQKQSEYHHQASIANAFWGTSPLYKPSFFLAHTAQEAVKNGQFETLFTDYMKAYGAVHESKILDRTLAAATAQLGSLADAVAQHEDLTALDYGGKADALANNAQRIRAEQQIHFQLLPSALQAEIVQRSGEVQGLSSTEALSRYQDTLQLMLNNIALSVRPYVTANPKITAPLTRTELEALRSLIEGQQSGIIGPRWSDYHQNTLSNEYARHLQHTLTAFSALQGRAQQLNQQLHQANQEEIARRAAEQQAQAAVLREIAQQRAHITYASVSGASALPFIAPLGGSSFPITPAAYGALQSAIRLAIPALRVAVLASGPALLATIVVGAVVIPWPKDEEQQRIVISIPLADLSPPHDLDLANAAASGSSVALPYSPFALTEESQTTLFITDTTHAGALGRVPVIAAQYDAQQQVYSVVLENPQRILTWTPATAPGSETSPTTTLPEHQPDPSLYEGASLIPVQGQVESYPALDLMDQERLIITFPEDSGLEPIYIMFKNPRDYAGTGTGNGRNISGWGEAIYSASGAPLPTRVADKLRGQIYGRWDKMREAIWKAIATDPDLSEHFKEVSLNKMRNGGSPYAVEGAVGKRRVLELHHIQPIADGGAVYDVDNLVIMTPSAHVDVHKKGEK